MKAEQVVERISGCIPARPDILALAWDRGRGEGMHIEKWMLIEMLAGLMACRREGLVSRVEGEHKYPLMKSNRFEFCDLWWEADGAEHFLEIKPFVWPHDQGKWKGEVTSDLEKALRLRGSDRLYHLAIVFPLNPLQLAPMKNDLQWHYEHSGLTPAAQWDHPLGEDRRVLLALFARTGPLKSTTKSRLEAFLGGDEEEKAKD